MFQNMKDFFHQNLELKLFGMMIAIYGSGRVKFLLIHFFSVSQGLAPSNASPEVCFLNKKMFPDKILIWMAIHDNGISQPFFTKAKLATK